MPIILNNSTGLVEDIPLDQAQEALNTGSHSLPMVSAEGNPVSVPYAQAQDALQQGFRQPNPIELKNLKDYAHYSSPEQQLKTAAEGAASTLTFGTSTGAQIGMGEDPEAIRRRREVNPGMHSIGEMAGLIGGSFFGTGEAAALEAAGRGAAELAGISGATLAGRAATTGIKQAAEMALFQAGDEVSKAFTNDPEQSLGSAILDTGLSGISGGAIGGAGHFVVGGLWNATVGPKLQKYLEAAKQGAEGTTSMADIAQKAEKAGLELDDVMRGALTPEGREAFRELRMLEGTKAGKAVNKSLNDLREQAENSILDVFGKTKEDIEKSSTAELGERLRSSLVDTVEPVAKVANEAYEKLREVDKNLPLYVKDNQVLARHLAEFATQNSFELSGTDELSVFNNLAKRLAKAGNISEVKTSLNEAVAKAPMSIKESMQSLRETIEENAYNIALEGKGEKIAEATRKARQLYSIAKSDLGDLGNVIGIDIRKMSPRTFVEILKNPAEISAESLINKFGNVKDASLVNYVQNVFPNAVDTLKEFHRNRVPLRVLKSGELNANAIYSTLADAQKMPKEIRDFAFTSEQLEKLNAIREVMGAIPPKMGPSGTPEGLRAIYRNLFTAMGGMMGFATGKGLMGLLAGKTAQYLTQEVPQALKLASLKMLGGTESVSASGFNAMFKAARASIRGTEKLNTAVANLFKPGVPVIESSMIPTAKSLGILHASMLATQSQPEKIDQMQGDLGHYLPNHSVALAATMSRASNYLATLQPNTGKPGMLDKPRQPSEAEKAKYNRALEIVQQPMMVLKHVQDGTITPEDVRTLNEVYPSLVNTFRQKITNELVEAVSKGRAIPYKTRLGLSLFLGQPVESSINSQNIMSNQTLYLPPPMPQTKGRPSGGFKASFSKLPNIYATPGQLRERNRNK